MRMILSIQIPEKYSYTKGKAGTMEMIETRGFMYRIATSNLVDKKEITGVIVSLMNGLVSKVEKIRKEIKGELVSFIQIELANRRKARVIIYLFKDRYEIQYEGEVKDFINMKMLDDFLKQRWGK